MSAPAKALAGLMCQGGSTSSGSGSSAPQVGCFVCMKRVTELLQACSAAPAKVLAGLVHLGSCRSSRGSNSSSMQ
jgi:hypothetical protein